MANENLDIDDNNKSVAGAVTDDANQFIKMLRIDDATKGLKVSIVGGGGSGTVTSISQGTGILLSTNPLITTGTVSLATSLQPMATLAGNSLKYLRVNAGETAVEYSTETGLGTVTSVSVTTANGVSGSVATATTTPAITLTLGAITPTSIGSATTATTQAQSDNSTKIATTAYVDNAVLQTNYKEAVKYASVAALPSIVYANGSSGVGATLTGVALAAISLDGASPGVGDRVLIKNQVSDFQNGIYVVTQTGSGIAVFILTRATDFDQAGDIKTGDATFITAGNTLANTLWAYTGIDSPTMGTTALPFVQVSADLITGQSVILSGTTTRILYNNAGVLGEYTISGTGTVVAMQTAPTFNTSITTDYLTASEMVISDGSKKIVSAPVATYPSLTELTYLKGVTSAIQTQINTKANSAGALTQFIGNGNWKVWYSDGSGDVTELALGASGTVLTSGGASSAPTFATPSSGSTPAMQVSTTFDTAARYSTGVSGGGTVTFGSTGMFLNVSTTDDSYSRGVWSMGGFSSFAIFSGSPEWSAIVRVQTITIASGTGEAFFGLGDPTIVGTANGIDFTEDHIGFKIVKTGGTATLYATQATGATETASSALTTVDDADMLDLILKVNGTSSVDYYWRKAGGSLSSATNLTTNIPTTAQNATSYMSSNQSNTVDFSFIIANASYKR